MTTATMPATTTTIHRYAFLVFLLPTLLPATGLGLGAAFGFVDAFAWLTLVVVFGLLPILDWLVGDDPSNPPAAAEPALGDDRFYRRLVYACVPVMLLSLLSGAWVLAHYDGFGPLGMLGWVASHGVIASVLGINAGHELIHKPDLREQRLGGLLLSLVCYGGFKVEHIRGHHVNVSTPRDPSSARFGQSLFAFLPVTIFNNVVSAWRLEAARLRRAGLPVFGRHNEVLGWYALSLAFAAVFTLLFGPAGLAFFLGQSVVAIVVLETVNYLEHYGLRRRQLPSGRYERTTHLHSWNSNHVLTNLMLFQLQRHSDHHANPRRRYQVLRHFPDSPQLPAGYATMVVLAWIPPLWRRVMDPRVREFEAAQARRHASDAAAQPA